MLRDAHLRSEVDFFARPSRGGIKRRTCAQHLWNAECSWTGKADSPATKLKAAAVELESHNSSLELRASELRRTAIALKHQSKTDTAIRCLRKAKVLELQIASNYSALDAIEQQIDMIAQAAVQKQLTTTLASTNKTMRSQCVSVETAESAFEGAAEVRELATDLEDVIAGFTQLDASRDGDDDLASELEAMVAAEPLPQETREFEIELLERKISEKEQRSALKQSNNVFLLNLSFDDALWWQWTWSLQNSTSVEMFLQAHRIYQVQQFRSSC